MEWLDAASNHFFILSVVLQHFALFSHLAAAKLFEIAIANSNSNTKALFVTLPDKLNQLAVLALVLIQ